MKHFIILLFLLSCLVGCRGWQSDKPPVHLNPNMDFQASTRSQEDPQIMPDHTVPWGMESAMSYPEKRDAIIKQFNKFLICRKFSKIFANKCPKGNA